MNWPESSAKPGYKTTEFWVTLTLIVSATTLIAVGKMTVKDVLDLWPMFGSGGAYSLGRGLAKLYK